MTYEQWRERLAEANDATFWPIEEIDRLLGEGTAQFWCDGQSAIVTRVVSYPGGALVVEVLCVAGNLDSVWNAIAPQVEQFGSTIGAKSLHALGRMGWSRSSRPHGWETSMVLITKDLSHEG